MKLEHFLTPYTKISSKWIKDLNVRPVEENTGRTLSDTNCRNIFLDPSPRVMKIKYKLKNGAELHLKVFAQQRKP